MRPCASSARCRASTADGDRRPLELELAEALVGAGRGRGGAPAGGVARRACRGKQETGSASSAGGCSTGSSSCTSRRRAPRGSWMPLPSRRCPSCSRWATMSRCTPCTRRVDGPHSAVAGRTLRATRTTLQPFTRGAPASSTSTRAGVRSAASTGRPPSPSSSRGSTPDESRAGEITGIAPPGDGRLRGTVGFDEARELLAASRVELAERGGSLLLGGLFAIESYKVEQLAGDAVAAAEFGADGCSAARAARRRGASCRARLRVSPRRSTDSTGSTRPIRGRRARPSSARATTP